MLAGHFRWGRPDPARKRPRGNGPDESFRVRTPGEPAPSLCSSEGPSLSPGDVMPKNAKPEGELALPRAPGLPTPVPAAPTHESPPATPLEGYAESLWDPIIALMTSLVRVSFEP